MPTGLRLQPPRGAGGGHASPVSYPARPCQARAQYNTSCTRCSIPALSISLHCLLHRRSTRPQQRQAHTITIASHPARLALRHFVPQPPHKLCRAPTIAPRPFCSLEAHGKPLCAACSPRRRFRRRIPSPWPGHLRPPRVPLVCALELLWDGEPRRNL